MTILKWLLIYNEKSHIIHSYHLANFKNEKFTLIKKPYRISHQKENISLAVKTPFNGTNFYKIQKNVLLTRQYVITNVKYTKQNCILY